MNEVYQLSSVLKLPRGGEAVTVPLFKSYPRNEIFVAKTDASLKLIEFDDLVGFENYICSPNFDKIEKTQYKIGDYLPIIVIEEDEVKTFVGESLREILFKLNNAKSAEHGPVADMVTLFQKLVDGTVVGQEIPQEDQIDRLFEIDSALEPVPSRLWLDTAVRDADERVLRTWDSKYEALNKVRLSLLAWTQEVLQGATTPVIRHFQLSLGKIERLGVYTEDIYAAVIFKRAIDGYKASDILDMIRDHRDIYGRGPLSSLFALTKHRSGPFFERAQALIMPYRELVEDQIKNEEPYALLALSFAADSPDQWGEKLYAMTVRRIQHKSEKIEILAERKQRLSLEAAQSKKFRKDSKLFGHIEEVRKEIRHEVAMLDSLKKLLSEEPTHYRFNSRFEVDYNFIGISEDFVT